ncbi:MAG: UDP-N-acetylglucosamine 1-carboxyvinyltransferase, partial [Alphaproteobacteria bacterium]
MDQILIRGGKPLNGVIPVSGAKNAALPLMIASLLTSDTLTLKNIPNLADTNLLARILRNHGADCAMDGKRAGGSAASHIGETFHLTARDIVDTRAPYEMVRRMRASFWVLGPLLARCGEATVSLPGGCAIGTRPVDWYLMGLQKLGAEIDLKGGYVNAKAPNGLHGAHISVPKVSVGATHTALMAAVLAKGETLIENAAREPEVCDVAECLVKMGAKIEGIGTSTLNIQGVDYLQGAVHTVLPDRIETGTYAMAVAATGGSVLLEGARPDLLEEGLNVLRRAGAEIGVTDTGIQITRNGAGMKPVEVETQPFPGFPT